MWHVSRNEFPTAQPLDGQTIPLFLERRLRRAGEDCGLLGYEGGVHSWDSEQGGSLQGPLQSHLLAGVT